MALQKRIKNPRYKTFTKQWLLDIGVDVLLDGMSTRKMSTLGLRMFFDDYKTLEVRQWSNKFKRWFIKNPVPNTKEHEKGIIGECTYYQVPICVPHKSTQGIPLHRIVYVWFNDVIEPYNEFNEKMEVCHINGDSSNNHIHNLKYDTAKNNRAQRKGAKNQYWKLKEKYGLEALYDYIK